MKKGDIVLVPFPFTDLTNKKRRPAFVLLAGESDIVLAFITTKLFYDQVASIQLTPSKTNGLKSDSMIRIDKVMTFDRELVIGKLGNVSNEKINEVNRKMIDCYHLR